MRFKFFKILCEKDPKKKDHKKYDQKIEKTQQTTEYPSNLSHMLLICYGAVANPGFSRGDF